MAQVWQLGAVKFADYGVYVAKSSNVLDVPSIEDEGYDWLDANGKSYWLDYTELNTEKRQIVLNCWIYATSYANLKTNTGLFFAAISQEGVETLTTPYGDISDVVLTDAVPVIRESSYVSSKQIGTFTLRLTVMPTLITKRLNVYRAGVFYNYLNYDTSMKVYKRLGGDCYMTCTVVQYTAAVFQRGDYVYLEVGGTGITENFYLDKDPEIKKESSNRFIVNYRFEQEPHKLRHIAFTFDAITTFEGDFYYFADASELLTLLIRNTDRYESGLFIAGTVDSTTRRNHKFSAQSCWDVLQYIATEYELEYEFTYTSYIWTINLKEKISNDWPYILEYGKGKGLYNIHREISKEELVTSLYAWGSEKNLNADYGFRRLKCPTMPFQYNVSSYGLIEKTVYFDDIYPAFTGTVAGYLQYPSVSGEVATKNTAYEQTDIEIYRITCNIGFDPTDTAHQVGKTPKIIMKTGDLQGFQFDIKRYDALNNYLFIKPSVDEYAGKYPSAAIPIAVNDTFTLIDIKQDQSYIDTAHVELLAAASAYMTGASADGYSYPKITYQVTVDPAFLQGIESSGDGVHAGFNTGDSINIYDADFLIDDYFRVSELTKGYYRRNYELTLSQKQVLTNREQMALRLAAVEKFQNAMKQQTVEVVKGTQKTPEEIKTQILDPADNKLDADIIIRNESIDPRMLAYDSIVPNVYLTGLIITLNFKGRVKEVSVTEGTLTISNWASAVTDRYGMKYLLENSISYAPRRTWTFGASRYVLPTTDGYYVYAKLPVKDPVTPGDENSIGTIEYSLDRIEVKEHIYDATAYFYYQLGVINVATSPRQGEFLWGNLHLPDKEDTTQMLTGQPLYGYLYNEDALTDARNIAASGWHVSTLSELQSLQAYASGGDGSGFNLKSTNPDFWTSVSEGGDIYGFDAVGAGTRAPTGDYSGINELNYIGSSSGDALMLTVGSDGSTIESLSPNQGRSARLVKDSSLLTGNLQTSWYTGNNGRIYQSVFIGASADGLEWTSQNLCETRYRTGAAIPEVTASGDWQGLTSGAWCVYGNDDQYGIEESPIEKFIEDIALTMIESSGNYVDVFEATGATGASGDLPVVTNANNMIRVTLGQTAHDDIDVWLGGMAGLKFWSGSTGEYDALGAWDDSTLYHITET